MSFTGHPERAVSIIEWDEASTVVAASYQGQITDTTSDTEWDRFVEQTPGGQYLQTSWWALVEGLRGRHTVRFVIRSGVHIVAGAQITLRRLPLGGAVGYISRGPVIALDDPALLESVHMMMHRITRVCHIQYLIVQPPRQHEKYIQQLTAWGFRPCRVGEDFRAGIIVDVTPRPDTLLSNMRKAKRQSIRRGMRNGTTVREGSVADLMTFYQLHVVTSQRQQFVPLPEDYFVQMWRLLSERGCIKMFLSEYEGEVVAGEIDFPFGDTVYAEIFGWSGTLPKSFASEVLTWKVMEWAHEQGYHYYSMGWIELEAARALEEHGSLPESFEGTATSFKVGLSKQVQFFPGSYDYAPYPLIGWASREVLPALANSSSVRNIVSRVLARG